MLSRLLSPFACFELSAFPELFGFFESGDPFYSRGMWERSPLSRLLQGESP